MRKRSWIIIVALLISTMTGCNLRKTTEINVVATTDLHGAIPYEVSSYVEEERKKDENLTVVDAGDFFDNQALEVSQEMRSYFDKRRENEDKGVKEHIEVPLAKEMKNEVGYDAVVLGNHEFVSNSKEKLDNLILDFEKQGISVLSANTYKNNGENYTKPYIIKEIKTQEGIVRLGILGLTIKEVDENNDVIKNGKVIKKGSRELKDMYGYNGQLYMNDLVKDGQKWVKKMKEDKTDIIVAVIHSGEKPKKPKNPGNRIQEIAKEVDGIDAIVSGHTHTKFAQHDYTNNSGENVIVTQPGKHGECVSKINFKLVKKDNDWEVVDKSSNIADFGKKIDEEVGWEELYNITEVDKEKISLSEVMNVDWDKAYVFEPGISKEEIFKTVGYKWRKINLDEREENQQFVFMKNNKVVCYIYGTESLKITLKESDIKNNVGIINPKQNDCFRVEKKEFTNLINCDKN